MHCKTELGYYWTVFLSRT